MGRATRFVQLSVLGLSLGAALDFGTQASWPNPGAAPGVLPALDETRQLIEAQAVCIASASWSAGALADTVLYRYRRIGSRVHVGYFAAWSTERPWGETASHLWGAPALLTDAFYSHFLFVFPGLQRVLYGPGDVEGAEVVYELSGNGRLQPIAAVAQNEFHDTVELEAQEFVDDVGRVVLLTEAWSHQLGARDAVRHVAERKAELSCFQGARLMPLTEPVIDAYRLGSEQEPRRAAPAWRLGQADIAKSSVRIRSASSQFTD